ncbi:hypothetical protein AB0L06_19330 [Spirillospora sp. NPDC052269]
MIAAIPLEFKTGEPIQDVSKPGDAQAYDWIRNGDVAHARTLNILIHRAGSQAEARRAFTSNRCDPPGEGQTRKGPAATIDHLGDKAFGFPMQQRAVWGGNSDDLPYDTARTQATAIAHIAQAHAITRTSDEAAEGRLSDGEGEFVWSYADRRRAGSSSSSAFDAALRWSGGLGPAKAPSQGLRELGPAPAPPHLDDQADQRD